ncbi:hypothetical protein FLACOL7796_04064 [Flavobacterium collinsii]|uniref:Uncharacterized protein n=1 Tax=Flavobacterium collinsii TaxID=1114861 RepID=A0ABM8KNN4_9FLAO|nr:hypothetical protein FLACOL7796_04064 [Flavobacterium collinsii]
MMILVKLILSKIKLSKIKLSKIKLSNSFKFSKCGFEKGCERLGLMYQCYSCNHVEITIVNTLFHKVKFGLQKAILIVFEMTTSGKILSSVQVGKRYGISQTRACFFMRKVRVAMKSR